MNVIFSPIPLLEGFQFNVFEGIIAEGNGENLIYHWHECFEISFVNSGEGVYYVNGEEFRMKKGDIIIFNNLEPHAWHAVPGEPMLQPVIVFDPGLIWSSGGNKFDSEYLKPFYGNCSNFKNKLPEGHEATKKILEILYEIVAEFNEKPKAYELMIKTKLLEVMTYLVRFFQEDGRPIESASSKKQKLMRLKKVFDFMNKNYMEKIKLEDAAKVAGMNPNYFSSFYKATTGMAFSEFLVRLRITKAVEMLRGTDETISAIAYSCGFNSLSNFYYSFEKIHKTHPASLRKR